MRPWQTIRTPALRHHVHTQAYAAVVLSGEYEEAGDSGRHLVRAGDVLVHDAFEAHLNRVASAPARILNLALPDRTALGAGHARVKDIDAVVRLAAQSPAEAATHLLSSLEMQCAQSSDWPDELASAILRDASLSLSRWRESKGILAWQLSRGFAQVFGIPPSAFRARARTRQAWLAIRWTDASLATIAADTGFSDQPHMTRSIRRMTGRPPLAWRAANGFKTR